MDECIDVAVIGAGPAGLAAATAARRAGVDRVLVLEREAMGGGVPRHCGHSPFGMRELGRVLSGRVYAAHLVERALRAGVELRTGVHVTEIAANGVLALATPRGERKLVSRRVIIATGARETPRPPRLISGDRPIGIMTTGAFQAYIYIERLTPFRRPVVVGSELVAYSALLTAWRAGIRPVAIVEQGARPVAPWPCRLLPRGLGIEEIFGARVVEIIGRSRVEGLVIESGAGTRHLDCDGVLLTGMFVPAAELIRQSHLDFDDGSGGPVIDQFGRCSDPAYFAAGNVLRPVETAGWSWREGTRVGRSVARDLAGDLPAPAMAITVEAVAPIKFALPQRLVPSVHDGASGELQIRLTRPVRGHIVASIPGGPSRRWPIASRPERRILIPLSALPVGSGTTSITISAEER